MLTVTVSTVQPNPMRRGTDLSLFDEELRRRGYVVETLTNPRSDELREAAGRHDAVFVGIDIPPGTRTRGFGTWGWRDLFMEHPQVCYTLYGNPYVAHELPHVPVLLAAYGGSPELQRAAARVWLGEMEALGSPPIHLPEVRIRSLPDFG